jgi:hypothetical protein
LISSLFILLSIFIIWKNTTAFPLAVPLWFSNPWGEERFAEPIFLWVFPVAGFLVLIINFFLSRYFRNREAVLYLLLLWVAPVVNGLLFYSLLQIIFVVT